MDASSGVLMKYTNILKFTHDTKRKVQVGNNSIVKKKAQCPKLLDNLLFNDAVSLFGQATRYAQEALRHIWQIGAILVELSRGYGEGVVLEEYATRINRSVRTVRRYRDIGRLAEEEFDRALETGHTSERKLLSLVSEKQRVSGTYQENTLKIIEDKEEKIENMALKLSGEVEELLRMKERREDVLPEDVVVGVTGVAETATEEVIAASVAIRTDPEEFYRSEKYLAYIRSLPCCVCDRPDTQAHHTEAGGVAMKGSDLSCIPLCPICHAKAHAEGISFWIYAGVHIPRVGWMAARGFIRRFQGV